MADAKKCDWCGEFYITPLNGETQKSTETPVVTETINRFGGTTQKYDLCPACVIGLLNWFKDTEVNKDDYYD